MCLRLLRNQKCNTIHMTIENHWYLVSSHGSILFYVAVNPNCTIKEIAEAMSLTRRTVWGSLATLEGRICWMSARTAAATTTP